MQNQKITLPAIEVEVPRMGLVVYVSPRTGIEEGKHTCMFTAEIAVNGNIECQSFHLKCRNKKEAESTQRVYAKRLAGGGPFTFIQTAF